MVNGKSIVAITHLLDGMGQTISKKFIKNQTDPLPRFEHRDLKRSGRLSIFGRAIVSLQKGEGRTSRGREDRD
jgi:hypothetical protein